MLLQFDSGEFDECDPDVDFSNHHVADDSRHEWEQKLNEGVELKWLAASGMAERSLSELSGPANIAADGDDRSRASVVRMKGEIYRQLWRRLVAQWLSG